MPAGLPQAFGEYIGRGGSRQPTASPALAGNLGVRPVGLTYSYRLYRYGSLQDRQACKIGAKAVVSILLGGGRGGERHDAIGVGFTEPCRLVLSCSHPDVVVFPTLLGGAVHDEARTEGLA